MTVRKKRETQQQTAVHDAWTHQAQSAAAQTAAEMGSMLGGSRAAWLEYQVPAPETKEGQERLRVYYEALGRFVQMFAEVEKVAAETLWRYVGTKAEIAKIVFSGVQMDHASTFIKQVAAIINTPLEIQADLKNVLDQLGVINGVRNRIPSLRCNWDRRRRATISDTWKTKAEPKSFFITPTMLNEMTDDLSYRHLGPTRPRGHLDLTTLEHVLQRPWHYKHHEQQKSQTRKGESWRDRKRGPKRLRQPQS